MVVEIEGLSQQQRVSSVLQTAAFRRHLENIIRGSISSVSQSRSPIISHRPSPGRDQVRKIVLQHEGMYLMTCTPSKDTDQHLHMHSQISLYYSSEETLGSWLSKKARCKKHLANRLSDSSLSAHHKVYFSHNHIAAQLQLH